ncbi:MAG: N-acetylmuramoyl-L-alanine amidase, partial [Ruminiclostridium sp.]|nr:N-acetylmuramoyl-L-alanine amidase [Ruminiclostridium sp.]
PVFSQLPANTLEIYRSTSGNYYVTESGKRFSASSSVLEDGPAITDNPLFVKSTGTSNGNSYIKIKLGHRTGFNMRLAGNKYYTAWDGDYNVYDFTATHLYITFENVTSVTTLPSFENNLVFRSGKWDTIEEENGTKFRLILELRQPGVYFGHGARYDENGDLILFFPVPVNSLSGLTVVIDPGHGYGKSPTVFDPGAVGEVVEQECVLAISKELESQLAAAGARVIRLKTESEFILTKERPNYARDLGCDIYISVHANKASADAKGVEAYYFTSYSEPLAASISKSIAAYYQTNVYADAANRDRGARYSYYHVTLQQDFPSVLVETGFVSNISDAVALASPAHRKGIAAGIVQGIKNYIARSSISYATEGYTAADNTRAQPEVPAPDETTAPTGEAVPEEADTPEDEGSTEPVSTEPPVPEESSEQPETSEVHFLTGGFMDDEPEIEQIISD